MWCPEEEKNEKEKREEKSMPALFMEINRQYGMRCMQRIREIGIQQGQMPIIMIVYRHNGCSQKEIAEWMGVTPPTVNVSIQRLEKADIVCRKRDDKDQRIMRVYLTENGRKIVEELQQESKAVEKVMFSNFSEAELCLLRRFFGQILDNISEKYVTDGQIKRLDVAGCPVTVWTQLLLHKNKWRSPAINVFIEFYKEVMQR